MKATEVFNKIGSWDKDKQIAYIERLLYRMTATNRAIWDDPDTDASTKVELLKWSNEFSRKIWKALFQLKNETEKDVSNRIFNDLKFCIKYCPKIKGHLAATIKSVFE